MRKKILVILLLFVLSFGFAGNISAQMTDSDCKACAEKNGGRCGYCRACALNDAGECVVNQHDKDLWDAAECAENAKTEKECNKCDGYVWHYSTATCIAKSTIGENEITSCLGLDKTTCEDNDLANKKVACVWVEKDGYCNVDEFQYVMCGSSYDIPSQAPKLVSLLFRILKIAVPIILVIIGMIGLVKALAASKEDEMKKAQSSLIKKIIAAALVFLVVSIVQFVISLVADDADNTNITSCINCFLNNDCQSSLYYKTNVAGKYQCTKLSDGSRVPCDEYFGIDK